MFAEKQPDEKYWGKLDKLIRLMYKNINFEEALRQIREGKYELTISSKAKYFISLYDEYCFNIDYQKQMAEDYQ